MSEVARLRAQIEAECESIRNMRLFAVKASHDVINNQYNAMMPLHDELVPLVGETEAAAIMIGAYINIVEAR